MGCAGCGLCGRDDWDGWSGAGGCSLRLLELGHALFEAVYLTDDVFDTFRVDGGRLTLDDEIEDRNDKECEDNFFHGSVQLSIPREWGPGTLIF